MSVHTPNSKKDAPQPTCFVIMPITTPTDLIAIYGGDPDHFLHVLEHLFMPALKAMNYEPWPPVAKGADLIHHEILQQLEKADLVLCDMSTLNANVFFELGIRTALNKPVGVVKDNLTPQIPFDMGLINFHTYDSALTPWSLIDEVPRLMSHLAQSVKGSEGQNTLWRRLGLTAESRRPVKVDSLEAKVQLLTDEIALISRRMQPSPRVTEPRSQVRGDPEEELEILFEGIPAGMIRGASADVSTRTISARASTSISKKEIDVLSKRAQLLGWRLEVHMDEPEFTSLPIEEVDGNLKEEG